MQHIIRILAASRFAWSTRRDLLLEILALRHQLAVRARPNRRLRLSDRLLWLTLRRVWPRWRDALVLVQPATVDRWHRARFACRWWRRSRRPGTIAHRFDVSRSDWAPGWGKSALGRAANSRRTAQARSRRFRTHSVALPARPAEETVTDLAHIHRESARPVRMRYPSALTVCVLRWPRRCVAWCVSANFVGPAALGQAMRV